MFSLFTLPLACVNYGRNCVPTSKHQRCSNHGKKTAGDGLSWEVECRKSHIGVVRNPGIYTFSPLPSSVPGSACAGDGGGSLGRAVAAIAGAAGGLSQGSANR